MISGSLKLLPLLIALVFGDIVNFSDVQDIVREELHFGGNLCGKYFDEYCRVTNPWNPHCAYRNNESEEQYELLRMSPTIYKYCTTCGIKRIYETKIYGGYESQPHSWPWMAGMYEVTVQNTFAKMICAASLISERYAITAAHCLIKPRKPVWQKQWYSPWETLGKYFFLRFGDHHQNNWWYEPQVDVPVSGYTIFKADAHDFFGDVALLELESPVWLTPQIHPVCLPPPNLNLQAPKTCIAVGWGLLNRHPPIPAPTLQEAEMEIVSPDRCKMDNPKYPPDMLACAFEPEKVVLQGDSGGGFFCQIHPDDEQWYLYGVTSFFSHGASGFSRVPYFVKWIHEMVR